MTERLADINARIEGIRQLGAVVNVMRSIAAARAQQARGQVPAVDAYADIIGAGIGRTLGLMGQAPSGPIAAHARRGMVVFCAEQGFAGAFSERVLDAIASDAKDAALFLIGTRGLAVAGERNIEPAWYAAMPTQSNGIPRLADHIAEALYDRIASGAVVELDVVFTRWRPGHGVSLERGRLFPLNTSRFPAASTASPPLVYLPPSVLLGQLTADYIHSRLCHAALHTFVAENEVRMEAMASAYRQIDRQLSTLHSRRRQVRQEEITAEIIELATGEMASRETQR